MPTILEWKHLLKPNKYKDIIIQSLQYLTSNKQIASGPTAVLQGYLWRPGWEQVEWFNFFVCYAGLLNERNNGPVGYRLQLKAPAIGGMQND